VASKQVQKLSDAIKLVNKPKMIIKQGKVISRNYYDSQNKGSQSKMVVGCKNTADSALLLSRNLQQMNSKQSNEYQLKNAGLPPRTNLKTVS
jgi:hypothetical protein